MAATNAINGFQNMVALYRSFDDAQGIIRSMRNKINAGQATRVCQSVKTAFGDSGLCKAFDILKGHFETDGDKLNFLAQLFQTAPLVDEKTAFYILGELELYNRSEFDRSAVANAELLNPIVLFGNAYGESAARKVVEIARDHFRMNSIAFKVKIREYFQSKSWSQPEDLTLSWSRAIKDALRAGFEDDEDDRQESARLGEIFL